MPTVEELVALIVEPAESLAIEHKSWLDLSERRDQAILAKAAIALSNHGGGIVVVGMRGDDAQAGLQSLPRPAGLARYRQDDVNAAINRYADPRIHCGLQFAPHPRTAVEHAFIVVSGDERVPIMSRRDFAGVIAAQKCYVRKPGPQSEEPFTAQEWRALLDRCVRAGRDEMLDAIRLIMQGQAGAQPDQGKLEAVLDFATQAVARWENLIEVLPQDDPGRAPHGRYELSFEIDNVPDLQSLADLRNRMDAAGAIRHTGWGPFVTIHREPLAPYPVDRAIEAWLGAPDPNRFQRTAAHCDFWRASLEGRFFLLRGFDEDGAEGRGPGRVFDITLPVWRIGEAMLYISRFARALDEGAVVTARCRYLGLRDRTLTSWTGKRLIFDGRRSRDNEAVLQTQASAIEIGENLAEVLHPMLIPLYEKFDFFELSQQLVVEELAEMRANRF